MWEMGYSAADVSSMLAIVIVERKQTTKDGWAIDCADEGRG
jgi:hypothetical protein